MFLDHNDAILSVPEKLTLIQNIINMQQQRFKRLKSIRKNGHIGRNLRHLLMKKEICLMREQKRRLRLLELSISAEETINED